jgi:hypothetical protein
MTLEYKNVIGKKLVVSYFDQNYNFEKIFPLTGIISEKILVGNQDFYIVQFEKSFSYNNNDFNKIVMTERQAGFFIGDDGEIHVHVLLPKNGLTKDHYEFSDFDHVVWAIVKNKK